MNEILCMLVAVAVVVLQPNHVAPFKVTNNCSSLLSSADDHGDSKNIRLPLHHINNPCIPEEVSSGRMANISTLILRDRARIQYLSIKMNMSSSINTTSSLGASHIGNSTTTTKASTVTTQVENGFPKYNVGLFMVTIKLGTPSNDYLMAIDTGSPLLWLQCQPCTGYCYDSESVPIFDPTKSSTYKTVPCTDISCQDSSLMTSSTCTASNNICQYNESYLDESFSAGILSRETLSIASATLSDFVYGCGLDNEGFDGAVLAGIAGLSRETYSLAWQLGIKYGNVFSYCLPTEKETGWLSFGSSGYDPSKYSFTSLISDKYSQLYVSHLNGMIIGKDYAFRTSSSYPIPMIVDSGTTVTLLPSSYYYALRDAFNAATSQYKRVSLKNATGLDTCLEVTSLDAILPDVRMTFQGDLGVKLERWNMLIDVVEGSVSCLAFQPVDLPFGIFGGVQQLKMTVVYDVEKSRVGFAPGCSSMSGDDHSISADHLPIISYLVLRISFILLLLIHVCVYII